MQEPIIQQTGPNSGEILNLERNEAVDIKVENFVLLIKRTDEGIVVDITDRDDDMMESLGSTYVFDSETKSFNPEQEM